MTKEGKEATIPDPIFAAIEAHRSAWVAEMGAMDRADEPLAREQGRTVTPADVEANERAKRATDDAMAALQQTAPVTMAGLGAAIAYLVAWDGDQMCEDASTGLQALQRSPIFARQQEELANV
jgi:hypothetical protein